MPATMTFKTLKKQALHLPPKRKAELAEALLQDEYERECLEKAGQCSRDIDSGKEGTIPWDEAVRGFKKIIAKASAKAAKRFYCQAHWKIQ